MALITWLCCARDMASERVIPATIAVETERVAPGHIVHRSPFARLNVASAGRALCWVGMLDQLQKMGFTCRFIDDEPTLMWSKLVFLAPFALSTTAADKTVGRDSVRSALAGSGRGLRAGSMRGGRGRGRESDAEADPGMGEDSRRQICAAPCRKMSSAEIRRNWTRSRDRFCAALSGTGSRCRRRRVWWRQWNGALVILSAVASSRSEGASGVEGSLAVTPRSVICFDPDAASWDLCSRDTECNRGLQGSFDCAGVSRSRNTSSAQDGRRD